MEQIKERMPQMRLFFLFAFFALSIGDAFNVLYIQEMARTFADEAHWEFFTGLPVTMMSASMIAGVCVSNYIADKKGDFATFIKIAIRFTVVGMLVRGLAFHYLLMLLGFMAVGFGYGCFYIGIRYYAYLFAEEADRMQALTFVGGGGFAGQCMGTVLGGIMAGQMPYRMVYLMAVLLMLPPIYLSKHYPVEAEIKAGGLKDAFTIIKDSRTVLYLVFMVVPMFACTIFTSYTIPLEVDGFGYSSTVISALLLGSYMISAYAGPFTTKTILSKFRPIRATYIYCIGVAAMIAFFSIGHTFPILVFVVLALGLLDSFGTSVMTEAYTGFTPNNESSVGSLFIYILVTRIGMTIAPTIVLTFGSALALSGFVIVGMVMFLLVGTLINIWHGKEKGK